MNEQIRLQVIALSSERRLAPFLADLMHQLTVAARAAYRPDVGVSERGYLRLKTINELQHQISSKLWHLLNGTPESHHYPDDVFLNILDETAGEFQPELEWALNASLRRFSTRAIV
ncbi:MAG TPA: hypothetical protein VJB57_06655 [Dehalococcoidia bacterium]|nr:hypothetical protein [Dehalococcoidia bacterium]